MSKKLKSSQATDLNYSSYQKEIKRATKLHFSILKKSIEAFNEAVELGGILKKIKSELPHGHFGNFLKSEMDFLSERTSQRYMQFHEKQNEIRVALGELLDISSATKFLSSLNTKNKETRKLIPEKTVDLLKDFQNEAKKSLKRSIKTGIPIEDEKHKQFLLEAQPKSFKRTVKTLSNQLEAIKILDIPDNELEPAISKLTDILRELETRKASQATDLKNE